MNVLASSLIAASAAVVLLLGLVHLLYTFRGTKLHPRDPQLTAALKEASPVLTRRKAWVGFSIPFRGIVFATLLYFGGLVAAAA